MSGFQRLIKNSIANIINGFSNVILGIVISPFLVSILSENEFSAWSINLQFGLFIGLFGVCIQTAIGKFVSEYKHSRKEVNIVSLFSSSMLLSLFFFVLFFLVVLLFTCFYSDFIIADDPDVYNDYLLSFVLISLSFLFGMLSSSFTGYFIGIERNDIIASVNLFSRVILGVCVVLTAPYGVVIMSLFFLLVNLLSFSIVYFFFKKEEMFRITFKATEVFQVFFKFVSGLAVWNVAQFLISGVGAFVIAKYQPQELPAYVLCMTLINAIVGVLGALISPIIQPIVRLNASGRSYDGVQFVLLLSLIFSLLIFLGQIFSYFSSDYIIEKWVGENFLLQMQPIFGPLLVAFTIRMVVAPYGMKLIAEGQQLKLSHYPVFEGLINFILAVIFVEKYGAVGVAYSTIIACVLLNALYANMFIQSLRLFVHKVVLLFSFILVPLVSVIVTFYLREITELGGEILNTSFIVIFGFTFYIIYCITTELKKIVNKI